MDSPNNLSGTLKHPSAFLPIAMSLLAIAVIVVHITFHGTAPQADEGTSAHLWQLLIAGQLPIVAFFAIRWFPVAPSHAAFVLILQAAAALAALGPVYLLHW